MPPAEQQLHNAACSACTRPSSSAMMGSGCTSSRGSAEPDPRVPHTGSEARGSFGRQQARAAGVPAQAGAARSRHRAGAWPVAAGAVAPLAVMTCSSCSSGTSCTACRPAVHCCCCLQSPPTQPYVMLLLHLPVHRTAVAQPSPTYTHPNPHTISPPHHLTTPQPHNPTTSHPPLPLTSPSPHRRVRTSRSQSRSWPQRAWSGSSWRSMRCCGGRCTRRCRGGRGSSRCSR
jgi:hypothetical protein